MIVDYQAPKLLIHAFLSLQELARVEVELVWRHGPGVAGCGRGSLAMGRDALCSLDARNRALGVVGVIAIVGDSLGRVAATRLVPSRFNLDLAAQFLDDALQFAQPLHQFDLALARGLFGRRIGIFWTRPAGRASWGRKDARDLGAAAIGARHVLVAPDLASPACYAASWVQALGGNVGGRVDGGTGIGRVRLRTRRGRMVAHLAIMRRRGCRRREAIGEGLDRTGRI